MKCIPKDPTSVTTRIWGDGRKNIFLKMLRLVGQGGVCSGAVNKTDVRNQCIHHRRLQNLSSVSSFSFFPGRFSYNSILKLPPSGSLYYIQDRSYLVTFCSLLFQYPFFPCLYLHNNLCLRRQTLTENTHIPRLCSEGHPQGNSFSQRFKWKLNRISEMFLLFLNTSFLFLPRIQTHLLKYILLLKKIHHIY